MTQNTRETVYLKNYQPTPHTIEHVNLTVKLDATETFVMMSCRVVPRVLGAPLEFHGEDLKLLSVAINGERISDYELTNGFLIISSIPKIRFDLEIVQSCNPSGNTQLSGLYLSNGIFCTQMEAEGFRRFAYFYDRPDVMTTYRVRIEAPTLFPVLLSNGNPIEAGDIPGTGNHYSIWEDPHPKPTYLFALVAGDLACVKDVFVTADNKSVHLGIYVENGKEDRCRWAMDSLKASMRWDERRFGRIYDLDVFNIVAVSDFNMGAMENKGLNIFNDKYVLARPDTAVDMDYLNIESIIGHEYFHNWTGNRITCRDWFQLCLKEGLTVFRDQEFTSDLRSRAVKRIQDVKTLRARQFPEDQGPLSHAVRPISYMEINNFYTPTVYEKGAEICRMLHTLIGETAFREGMDLYFERHDGEAVTVEDFLRSIADASDRDLTQFALWYEQSGTPHLDVTWTYNATARIFEITAKQFTPPTAMQSVKQPLHMPFVIGLLGPDGSDLPLHLEGVGTLSSSVLELQEAEHVWRFTDIWQKPVPSINRGYAAPVVLQTAATESDLVFLMGHDSDPFNRWESAQFLGRALLVDAARHGFNSGRAQRFVDAIGQTLANSRLDNAFKSAVLTLPPEAEIAASFGGDADSDKILKAREQLRHFMGTSLKADLLAAFTDTETGETYAPDPVGTARRSLRCTVLSLLAAADGELGLGLAQKEIASAKNMTAEYGSLVAISGVDHPIRDSLFSEFHARHADDPLLIDKWFMLHAGIPGDNSYQRIETLMQHPDFKLSTPNRVYALIGSFAGLNLSGFNARHGDGYRVVADAILSIDGLNPQVASRLATGFRSWKIFDAERRAHAQHHMERILAKPGLSVDVFEIISRTLG